MAQQDDFFDITGGDQPPPAAAKAGAKEVDFDVFGGGDAAPDTGVDDKFDSTAILPETVAAREAGDDVDFDITGEAAAAPVPAHAAPAATAAPAQPAAAAHDLDMDADDATRIAAPSQFRPRPEAIHEAAETVEPAPQPYEEPEEEEEYAPAARTPEPAAPAAGSRTGLWIAIGVAAAAIAGVAAWLVLG
ncbi:MAG: hypothetical protein AB7Q97_05770 [Gammaproteobacteria bacterium]